MLLFIPVSSFESVGHLVLDESIFLDFEESQGIPWNSSKSLKKFFSKGKMCFDDNFRDMNKVLNVLKFKQERILKDH